MNKDNFRDYATEAFRFYAACGKLTADEIMQRVREDIYTEAAGDFLLVSGGSYSDAVAHAVMRAEDAIKEMGAEIADIVAVEKTMRRLNSNQKKAVEIVYFTDPEEPIGKNEISARVHKAEMEIHAGERTVYRWLATARKIFAEERGLRTTKRNFSKVGSSEPKKYGNMVSSKTE